MIAITTRYVGATSARGERIIAETANGHKLSRPYNHALDTEAAHAAVACELARTFEHSRPNDILVAGETKNGYVFTYSSGSTRYVVAAS